MTTTSTNKTLSADDIKYGKRWQVIFTTADGSSLCRETAPSSIVTYSEAKAWVDNLQPDSYVRDLIAGHRLEVFLNDNNI